MKNSDVPVTDRPFIPPTSASTSIQQQKSTGQKKIKKTSQPPEVSGVLPGSQLVSQDVVSATQPVEAPGTDTENLPADQEPVFSTTTGVRPQLHSPVPTVTPGAIFTGPQSLLKNRNRKFQVTGHLIHRMKGSCLARNLLKDRKVLLRVTRNFLLNKVT